MKLLALVTLYYPPAHITDNLLTYAEDVDGLFVWDNTPGGSNYQFPESISHKIVRLRQGENTGIGKALNAAAMFALDNGYTYLLTMDQDSAFTASTFKDYIRIINNDKDSSHFAYIPLINASGTDSNAPLKEAQGMIISGSIFPLKTIQKVGLYLDKFVMDAIDTEYFLRIRRHTGKVMLVPAANLKHELGHPLRKQILIWHPMSLNYSPVRTYYIARNFLPQQAIRRVQTSRTALEAHLGASFLYPFYGRKQMGETESTRQRYLARLEKRSQPRLLFQKAQPKPQAP